MSITDNLKISFQNIGGKLFKGTIKLPDPGLYHYRREGDGGKVRLHLRLDPDGQGLLMVNANRVFHLNPTAALMAYLNLEEMPEDQVIQSITRRYHVSNTQARADYEVISAQVKELIRPDGACPICDLDLETTAPFTARPSAPYRMDLVLTYRCNNNCTHCYNARPRNYPEIKTEDWIRILDGLWKLGIPHIVFTGGEPTLRDDLPELIAHAEKNGQITGINTNGRKLSDPAYLKSLVEAGLDHVQITFESHDPTIHDKMVSAHGAWQQTVAGLRNALATPLYVMTNTTLLSDNSPTLSETLDTLAYIGVPTVGLNALIYSGRGLNVGSGIKESELPPMLDLARQKTDAHGQRLIWYTPTQYCHFDPVQMELGVKGCTAALYNMAIEPDGAVIPCQSYYHPLGNIMTDSWDSIWNHGLAVSLRERKNAPAECSTCQLLPECGGGCPLARHAMNAELPKPEPFLMS
ncbi:MAG TPA: radical SAM protein [Anaerolineaceae bacterium]|jgi:radical SAM protein with 4Fe4S-binding SPASM domain